MQNQYLNSRPPIEMLNTQKADRSRLTALEYIHETVLFGKTRRTAVICLCDCGNKITTSVHHFKNGGIRSCGCLIKNHFVPNKKYNSYNEKLRNIYYAMIGRCHIPHDLAYKYYGERGVIVCNEWRNNGQTFFDWAIQNGWQPGLDLDKDKLGNGLLYSPQTCCFITELENSHYKRSNVRILYKEEMLCLSQVVLIIGCTISYLRYRLKKGKSAEDIEKEYNESTDVRLNKFKPVKYLKN